MKQIDKSGYKSRHLARMSLAATGQMSADPD